MMKLLDYHRRGAIALIGGALAVGVGARVLQDALTVGVGARVLQDPTVIINGIEYDRGSIRYETPGFDSVLERMRDNLRLIYEETSDLIDF